MLALGAAPASFVGAGLPASLSRRTCFCGMRKSSMFAEMPLDNRTVDQFENVAVSLAFSSRFETSPLIETI
jgi:hypothetical protein